MPEPTFDSDGYPTEETLEAIKHWSHTDIPGVFKFLKRAWRYPDYFTSHPGIIKSPSGDEITVYNISTGGWSGNESLISALKKNYIIWSLTCYSSQRGGYYVFEVKNIKE